MSKWLLCGLVLCSVVVGLTSCAVQGGPPIPPVEQFTVPAVGTPIPSGSATAPLDLPAGSGGVVVVNQIGDSIKVVVSGTIATIPNGQGFLFILPLGAHDFYIYESNARSRVHSEQIIESKVRYVYLLPTQPPQ